MVVSHSLVVVVGQAGTCDKFPRHGFERFRYAFKVRRFADIRTDLASANREESESAGRIGRAVQSEFSGIFRLAFASAAERTSDSNFGAVE